MILRKIFRRIIIAQILEENLEQKQKLETSLVKRFVRTRFKNRKSDIQLIHDYLDYLGDFFIKFDGRKEHLHYYSYLKGMILKEIEALKGDILYASDKAQAKYEKRLDNTFLIGDIPLLNSLTGSSGYYFTWKIFKYKGELIHHYRLKDMDFFLKTPARTVEGGGIINANWTKRPMIDKNKAYFNYRISKDYYKPFSSMWALPDIVLCLRRK